MKKLLAVGCWLLAFCIGVGCSSTSSPEEQASQAALSYYQRLLNGYPDGLLAAKADVDSLPADYRKQLEKGYVQYLSDIKEKHGGLRAVDVSSNIARIDTVQKVAYAFLILSFNDSTQEEITVPMVEINGKWCIK